MSGDNNNNPKLDVRSDEQHLLLDHNYDGIQELNHPLPRWWNTIFYTAIAFSVVYFIYYQLMGGPSLKDEFDKEYAHVLAVQEEFKAANIAFKRDVYDQTVAQGGVKKGAEVFELYCMPCHAEKGRGDVGPNLTDEYWLLAKSTPETIYPVVFNGSEENGMPPWGETLTPEELYQVVSYVSSLKNTHQPNGKPPQGEKIEE